MKVITLKQPWATLIAEGLKKYEFRSWKTNYVGNVLIHAGKGIDKEAMEKVKFLGLKFPQSKVIAIAHISDCIKLDKFLNKQIIQTDELIYGNDYNREGYAWVIDNVSKINIEEKISGKLGLWNLDINIK